MKSGLIILLIFFLNINSFSQAPQAVPYQAVARNTNGDLISNQSISIRFTIHDLDASGIIVFSERQNVTTNQFGLFSLNIGQGIILSGNFNSIDWGNGSKFLQIEIDSSGGANYIDLGTQQMLSV